MQPTKVGQWECCIPRTAHMAVDDGTVPMCKASGAPFYIGGRGHVVGLSKPIRFTGDLIQHGEKKPPYYKWCDECARRYRYIHRTEKLPE